MDFKGDRRMVDFISVLREAQQLSEADRYRLIDALWESVPITAEHSLHPEWETVISRRIAELESGKAESVDWENIRTEAYQKLGHGKTN
jgi:putative addiction module component (TIGR02574 family)